MLPNNTNNANPAAVNFNIQLSVMGVVCQWNVSIGLYSFGIFPYFLQMKWLYGWPAVDLSPQNSRKSLIFLDTILMLNIQWIRLGVISCVSSNDCKLDAWKRKINGKLIIIGKQKWQKVDREKRFDQWIYKCAECIHHLRIQLHKTKGS